ncbi:MAG: DUF5060 domain-containing protein [Verrucomicrobiota bacterium]
MKCSLVPLLLATLLLFGGRVDGANQVLRFDLINADTDSVLFALSEGSTIDLSTLPTTNLNIRAVVDSEEADTESVAFSLTGATTRQQTESAAPYALAGDAAGDYSAFAFNPGGHTLTATPYTGDSLTGASGVSLTLNFTVALTPPPSVDQGAFLESQGLVVMDVEALAPVAPWSQEASVTGFLGSGYFRGTEDHFNNPGQGNVAYPVFIGTAGRYQLQWRSQITFGDSTTEHNDSFARLVDAKGNPVTPAANDNDPTGSWYKVYMNATGWSWQTSNKDFDARSLSWNLAADTLYYLEIAVRSTHHALDRIVLWDQSLHNFANETTGKQPNNSALDALALSVQQAAELPVVTLTSPLNGTLGTAPADFLVTASASDPNGSVTQVEFFQDGSSLGIDSTAPYTVSLNGLAAGNYRLTAVARDDDNHLTTSEAVVVRVGTAVESGLLLGELKKWHKITLSFDGPATSESASPNPFLDYRLDVTFTGPSGQTYLVPGHYAADGNAANTGADNGNQWQVHFSPDEVGLWSYSASFLTGSEIAIADPASGSPASFHGASGSFLVVASDKTGRDFRGKGRLEYVGQHYLQFAESGEYFIKQGPDAPENFLSYVDFDGPFKTDGQYNTGTFGSEASSIKTWSAHAGDWTTDDPTWAQVDGVGGAYGKGMLGALNYLASEGLNVFSFLTFNIAGDDRNVFLYTDYNERERMDVSRLGQWEVIFEHATRQGLFLHVKTQETENDLLLDGGELGKHRQLYYRELIARFGHHLALNWNLGEENDIWRADELNDPTQTRVKAYAQFFHDHDPYQHPIVIHTYPNDKDEVYGPLVGSVSQLTGASLQGGRANFNDVHDDVRTWVANSAQAGKPWIVACDEPGDAENALRPDSSPGNSHENGRENALWGTLLAGGWGNEWYFGYGFPHSDLTCQDFRSRDQWWDYCRYALEFFALAEVPYWEMINDNSLTSGDYCYFKAGEAYVIYDKQGGTANLDLADQPGEFTVRWFDPRNSGALQTGSVSTITGGSDDIPLGSAPDSTNQDWVALVTASKKLLFVRGADRSGGFLEAGNDNSRTEQLADLNNNATNNGNHGWGELKTLLEGEGYLVEQLAEPLEANAPSSGQTTGAPLDLTQLGLSQYSALIFGSNNAVYTSAQIDALEAYVRAGGAALFISDANFGSDWCDAPNSDQQFLDRFGLEMNQDSGTYTVDRAEGEFVVPDHPIFSGVDTFMGEGVSPGRIPSGSPPAGVTLTRLAAASGSTRNNDGTPGVNACRGSNRQVDESDASLVIATVESGRVAIHFDRNTFFNQNGAGTDINEHDNAQYARNLFAWLSQGQPETTGPTAVISAAPLSGETPLLVQFDASNSSPTPGASLTSYAWDFESDGTVDSTEALVSHTYPTAGTFTVTLTVSDDLTASDSTTLAITAATQAPFANQASPWPLPGRVEAENFDSGGEGIAYSDQDIGNNGDSDYRPGENVDIQNSGGTDSGGLNVGWTSDGEWLEYTVTVSETGTHRALFRVASNLGGANLRLLVDGVDQTGSLAIGNTGGWQNYIDLTSGPFLLEAGTHLLRLEWVTGGCNLNWFEVERVTQSFSQFMAGFPSLSGELALATADPDGDRLSNLLEQWLRLNPTQPDVAGLPLASVTGGELHFRFSFDSSVTGSTLRYESSEDLVDWDPQSLLSDWITEDGDMRHVEATFPISSSPDPFHRLLVE